MLHKHSFVAFARMLLLILALINFQKPSQSKDHKYSYTFAKFYEQQSQTKSKSNTWTNQDPKQKKPIKFNFISFHNKMKMQTLKQWCLHLTLHLTSQLNNDVAAYGVGIFVAHIGHLHKIHDLYNNKTYSWPKQKTIVTFVIMYRQT